MQPLTKDPLTQTSKQQALASQLEPHRPFLHDRARLSPVSLHERLWSSSGWSTRVRLRREFALTISAYTVPVASGGTCKRKSFAANGKLTAVRLGVNYDDQRAAWCDQRCRPFAAGSISRRVSCCCVIPRWNFFLLLGEVRESCVVAGQLLCMDVSL